MPSFPCPWSTCSIYIRLRTWCLSSDLVFIYSAFVAHSSLTSGCGVHYAPSVIVDGHSTAKVVSDVLVVGKRLPPRTLRYSADHLPVDIQDLCPSDGRFKLLVFVGDLVSEDDRARLDTIAFAVKAILDVMPKEIAVVATVMRSLSPSLTYMDVPGPLRPNWTR